MRIRLPHTSTRSDAGRPAYLDGYSAAQLAIIESPAPIKQVIAAAGSGKTRTVIGCLEHRLRGDSRLRAVMLSFSRRAVRELTERLPAGLRERVEICTFHAFCFRTLRSLAPERRLRIFGIEDRRAFLNEALREGTDARQLRDAIGGVPYDLLFADRTSFAREQPEAAALFFARFAEYKTRHGLYEYDDLVAEVLAGLRENDPLLRARLTRYGLVIVDEFQDTDPEQLEFLQRLDPPELTVVGDDWQAIYAFRGATIEPFLNFRRVFRSAAVFRLAENYRSLPAIVRQGNRLIRASRRQLRKRVRAVREQQRGLPVLRVSPERPGPNSHSHSCAEIEAQWRARLERLIGERADQVMILTRTNFRRQRWLSAGFCEDQVLTVHRAKGLEFPVVCVDLLGGWSEAAAGQRRREGEASAPADEEIRILYVAASRAENLLLFLYEPAAGQGSPERWFAERFLYARGVRALSSRPARASRDELGGYLNRAIG